MAFIAQLPLIRSSASSPVPFCCSRSSASSSHLPLLSCLISSSAPRANSGATTCTRRSILHLAAVLTLTLALPDSAKADRIAAATRRAYERYVPRILRGHEALMTVRQALVDSGEAQEAVGKLLEDKEFSKRWRRAMDIYAGTFSDNYLTAKTRDLRKRVNAIFDDLEKLRAVGGEDGKQIWTRVVESLDVYAKGAKLPGLVEGLAI